MLNNKNRILRVYNIYLQFPEQNGNRGHKERGCHIHLVKIHIFNKLLLSFNNIIIKMCCIFYQLCTLILMMIHLERISLQLQYFVQRNEIYLSIYI